MSEPLLQADNLVRYYTVNTGLFKKGVVKALDGASFTLEPGKTLAIVGESGCGKSTLARLLSMIEKPTSGHLKFKGEEADVSDSEMRKHVQIVFQNPYGSLNPRHKIGYILEEPLKLNTKLNASERREKAMAMMARVGLRLEHYERYPHMFSGGQRQRIAIARSLMLEPEIIVLDEPVSALDLSIQAQVLNILNELQEEFSLAYVFISHDLSVVRHIADDVMVMYLGKVVESGSCDDIFDHAKHPYTQALLSATPMANPNHRRKRILLSGELPSPLDPPKGCHFNPRCRYASDKCLNTEPELEQNGNTQIACFHPQ